MKLRLTGRAITEIEAELWSRVVHVATAQPTPVVALAVSGMNHVLNSQGYAQAAWWNRIPAAAWMLMGVIAIASNILFGYGSGARVCWSFWSCRLSHQLPFFLLRILTAHVEASSGLARVI